MQQKIRRINNQILGLKSVHLFRNIQLFGFSQTGVQKKERRQFELDLTRVLEKKEQLGLC